ncbi:sugar ABC transporter substrate-binding protein [Alloiococcus sp. CFN-8]|uniref:sugar ABC transporter substrate-binding protein n=1 Tax=Alloiococcus sp. CFN-8 TaxID=3416081 RepID=UPI003CFB0CA7
MKKLLVLGLISTMLLSFTACGNKDKADAGSTEGKTLTVGIWGGNDAEAAALDKVVSDFEEKTGATVELKTYTDINTQLQADFIGKTAPDVFYVDGSMFPFYASLGVLEELDKEEMGTDKYYENLLAAFTAEDDKVYAIPKDVSTLAMYVNTDLLAEVGMTVKDIPGSLEEMVDFLPELQKKLDDKFGAGQVTAMTYNQDLARNLHLFERNGGSVVDENENSTLSSADTLKNIEFMMDLVATDAYKTPAELGLGWNGEVFGTGKAVIMEEGNWVYGNLVQNYPEINFEVIDMPSYLGEKSSMSFTVGYAIYNGSENKELAKEWIKYATGEGMATWCSGAGVLPSSAEIAEVMDVESDPVWKVHLDQVEYAVPWQKGTTISIVNSAYQNFIPSVVKGERTLQDAMEASDKQANDEIANSK